MDYTYHNVVSLLYAIKNQSEAYQLRSAEGLLKSTEERLAQAEEVLKRNYEQAVKALLISQRLKHAQKPALPAGRPLLFRSAHVLESWGRVKKLLEPGLRCRDIRLLERFPASFPRIHCRIKDLDEILYHLGKNAVDAMTRGGHLVLRLQYGMLEGGRPSAVLQLSDTGEGISAEALGLIFDPFFTTKSVDQGNGLGLAIVRSLVERNAGRISVASLPGEGTSFTLEFLLESEKTEFSAHEKHHNQLGRDHPEDHDQGINRGVGNDLGI